MLVLVAVGCTMQPADGTIGSSEQAATCLECGGTGGTGGGGTGGSGGGGGTTTVPPPPPPPASGGTFTIHALGKMCLDFGGQAYWAPGAPVTLYWCNGSIAQELDVQEVAGAGHDVTLHVGTGLDNNYCIGARGGHPVAGAVLEMQVCNGSDAQQFALDGDSIIAGPRPGLTRASLFLNPLAVQPIQRQLVAKPLNDVTNAKTPIVLGPRQLTENEYLRFVATDGTSRPPHSGFMTPPTTGAQLRAALQAASWGQVITIPDSPVIYTLNGTLNVYIPAGVTMRGDRKFTGYGPFIEETFNESGVMFLINAADVRVTGIHFQGATWGTDETAALGAIRVQDGATVTIDPNEFTQFTTAAVDVRGTDDNHNGVCPLSPPAYPRQTPVRVSGNFFHHNIANNQGYGVVADYGGFPLVERNVGYMNRHTIAASYDTFDGYVATDNFVQSQGPAYGFAGLDKTANFDVHGSVSLNCADRAAGYAGDYVIIQYNTLLSDDRPNIKIRGESCRTGTVDGNIFAESSTIVSADIGAPPDYDCYGVVSGAVVNYDTNGYAAIPPPHLDVTRNNAYSQPAPVDEIAVGDFDGDGIDDIFTTTGTGWFYSSGGVSEWRWLRRAAERVDALRLGDLDGDGRTDVITAKGNALLVSWGGVSGWQQLTTTPAALPITSYAIGNFDGDRLHGDDIFVTDGATWWVAKNGHNFSPINTSSFPASSLRFGDFDGDGKTDVFAITGGRWSFSSAAATAWQPIPGAPTTSNVNGLIVGDFDGDGRTNIGRYSYDVPAVSWKFDYSPNARAAFTGGRLTTSAAAWAGHFTLGPGVIWWDGDEFDFAIGTSPTARLSRQHMK
jgi:hypothetical protein